MMALFPYQRVQNPEPPFRCAETPEAFFLHREDDLARFAGHGVLLIAGTRGCPYVAACGVLAGSALLGAEDVTPLDKGRYAVHTVKACKEGRAEAAL